MPTRRPDDRPPRASQPARRPSRPATVADPSAALEQARRQTTSPLPGATEIWMFVALIVFVAAIALAFLLNDDGSPSAPAAVAAQASSEPASQPDGAAPQPTTAATPAAAAGSDEPNDAPAAEAPPEAEAPVLAAADGEEAPPPPPVSPLLGFQIPVAGACVPTSEALLPGAPRTYRNGIHEGVDFYSGAVGGCPPELSVTLATPILAAKRGVVIRADWDYAEITQAELDAAAAAGHQGEEILDRYRGRQIWIDHGAEVVSRYAHLGAIAAGIQVGQTVEAGQIIGFAGESGTPESVNAPGTDIHLHFEIRVGEGYLGEGLPIAEARGLYLEAFGVVEASQGG